MMRKPSRCAGVVQSERFVGYTESGQSRANQGIPRFACNPDLNHATSTNRASKSVRDTLGMLGDDAMGQATRPSPRWGKP